MVSTNEPAVDGEEVKSDAKTVKAKKSRGGPRKPRKPKFKDWIRVQKSTGNGLDNKEVLLRINEANGVVELITNAPKLEGSDEPEGQRTQVFKVTSFQTINDPEADPLGEKEAAAEAAKAPKAPAEEAPAS